MLCRLYLDVVSPLVVRHSECPSNDEGRCPHASLHHPGPLAGKQQQKKSKKTGKEHCRAKDESLRATLRFTTQAPFSQRAAEKKKKKSKQQALQSKEGESASPTSTGL